MLAECKKALRVTVDDYDSELADLLMAGGKDLEIAGVILPGELDFSTDATTGAVTDNSAIDDALVRRALITYAAAHFGNPPNADRLKAAYDEQKVQLMHASAYTDYNTGGGCR